MRFSGLDQSGRIVRERAWRPPAEIFAGLSRQRFPVWLDSNGPIGPRSRFSFLCIDPSEVVEQRGGWLRRNGVGLQGRGFDALAAMVADWRRPMLPGPAPFMGGAVGLLGYDLGRELETLPTRHRADPDLPSLWFGLYDLVLAFDRLERRSWLISTGLHPLRSAAERADWFEDVIDATGSPDLAPVPPLVFRPDQAPDAYRQMVRRGLELIEAGDIFQANLTMRHVAERPPGLDPAAVYLALREGSPAAFGAFIGWEGGRAVASASPERFVLLDREGVVETRPVKGTIRRQPDPSSDAVAIRTLAASVKDRAENLMIVDLMRNDLARVCETGSVSVPALFEIDSIATLHHLVSTVSARLRPGEDAVSLLRASFPGGSITGAPKIRAMEIIDALEASARGPYCGSVAWIGHDGAMDSSILIRSLFLTTSLVFAHAGGGIVADSDPDAEHAEMLAKLASVLGPFR
ncbi:anthranilate synthase component I family protein [Acetobacteraceae bacterium KSS8]|uniref:Anthranilate synthase component I family protein n=1 Tax=Endosaccharibacter trunci TaxID=2812733 RepID=A0ABT1W4M6_9PROT|nr:anthranilate synthase component I family protein [Acetobacteraceae bacterium KSS8]